MPWKWAPNPPECYDKSWLYNAEPTIEGGRGKALCNRYHRFMDVYMVFWPTTLPGTFTGLGILDNSQGPHRIAKTLHTVHKSFPNAPRPECKCKIIGM